ncbi:MAG: YkvA family protein [Candidatus Hodarchaeota archaeon]
MTLKEIAHLLDSWKKRVKKLKEEVLVLYIASKDPRVSRWRKLLLGIVIGYLFCPLDLIPDFIPILGYLDDLLLVPFGIWLMAKIIPPAVLSDAREYLRAGNLEATPVGRKTAILIVFLWIATLVGFFWLLAFFML